MGTKKILTIAPHHDDEIIGCGGTLALLNNKGYNANVVHVFNGSSGVFGSAGKEAEKLRYEEAERASKVLNFTLLPTLPFNDRHEGNVVEVQNALIKVIRAVRPSIVFAPHINEKDFEHQIVAKASWEATWLAATSNFPELGNPIDPVKVFLGYEVWTPMIAPNLYFNITDYEFLKAKALGKYESQVKNTDWVGGSLGLNRYRGTTLKGFGLAEVFELKTTNVADLIISFELLNSNE